MKRETSEEDSRSVIPKKNEHRLSDKLHWTLNSSLYENKFLLSKVIHSHK